MCSASWVCFGALLGQSLPTALAKVQIESMKHDIQGITASNFDGVISKFRDVAVSAVWFYNDDNKEDEAFLDEYNKVATDLKGMNKITAMSCTEFGPFCKKQGVTTTPTIMIYPPNPVPAFKYEGKMESKAIAAKVTKFVLDMSTRLTTENVDSFLTTDPTKPKVMLFSSKPKVPTMWKALSSETMFKRTIKFGFASEEDKEIVAKFKVKKFPTVLMQRGAKSEIKEEYKGELKFTALKDWVNVYSESGMGDKVQGGSGKEESMEEAKPWLVQEIPELTGKSYNDICFKGEGLCVIYMKDGEITQAEIDMLKGLEKGSTSQLSDRGAKLRWMWINLGVESAYKELFNPAQLPSALVFNPHKRLRFAALDHGEDNDVKGDETAIGNLVDKVLGGDARFKMVPGQKLPTWAVREAKAQGKKEL